MKRIIAQPGIRGFYLYFSFIILILASQKVSAGFENTYYQYQTSFVVQGIVMDAKTGEPLQGATIAIEGTKEAARTDEAGSFSINVEREKAILIISYSGYTIQRITLGYNKYIKISLIEDAAKLNEVVIVGYGKQSKNKITGSIATVKGEEIIKSNAGDLSNSLAGRVQA